MSGSASWQAWHTVAQPTLNSILNRSVVRGKVVPKTLRSYRCIPLRHVSFSIPRKQDVPLYQSSGDLRKDVRDRKAELDHSGIDQYPRIGTSGQPTCSLACFVEKYTYLEKDQVQDDGGESTVTGRISSVRKSGGKLAFIDIVEEPGRQKLQIILNLGQLQSVDQKEFTSHLQIIRRGDVISAKGFPQRSSAGELSLRATCLTTMLSPCLHSIPMTAAQTDLPSDSDLLDKHVAMLADPSITQTLITRSKLIRTMRQFFESRDFYEVQTPIIAASAGGATARPFETSATDFPDKKMSLRIAPELWLKRLILGGMPRVFEIGPSFRNEGLDNTHNPEFTTCEFYAAYYTLTQLQRMTEQLLRDMSSAVGQNQHNNTYPVSSMMGDSNGHFREIDFIPAINAHLGQPLPNLSSADARAQVLEIFSVHSLPIPAIASLPRLLDKLCSHLLEPSCDTPTWITNTPECLSPLAKSFIHPSAPNSQPVAARAELFINQKEIVNCYEEENSPAEQRRKFIEQQTHARLADHRTGGCEGSSKSIDEEAMKIDYDYLRALEWGLPPTGGWGCGVDRLVMLLTGKQRISEVLSFGNLKAVARGAERSDQ